MANMQNICEHIFARGKGFAQIQHSPVKVDSSSHVQERGGLLLTAFVQKASKARLKCMEREFVHEITW